MNSAMLRFTELFMGYKEKGMRVYEEPRLQQLATGIWQVSVRFPEEIRKNPDHRKRVSTKTKDKKLAEKLKHNIVADIYAEFDKLLGVDPLVELLKQHWPKQAAPLEEVLERGEVIPVPRKDLIATGDTPVNMGRIFACWEACNGEDGFNAALATKIFDLLTKSEARAWYAMQKPLGTDPRPLHLRKTKQPDPKDQKDALQKLKDGQYLNESGAPKLSEFLTGYSKNIKWERIKNKTKGETFGRINDCINIIGDLPVDKVLRQHATMIASTLHDDGYANSTIKTWLGAVRGLLQFVVDNELNPETVTPWLNANTFYGFSAESYGTKGRSFEALKENQLHDLFSLDMPELDRLMFNILITTGMRLDEVALLEWEQYKVDRNGLRYFDLSLGSIVKNDKFSARTVAIPDVLQLPEPSKGRLFDFDTDSDGKSSKQASRHLNEKYVHKIRYNKEDDRKVVHSLRHNLSGFMLNLKPTPSSEVMDWITGHGMEGKTTQSERQKTYGQDPDVLVKYEVVNKINHPWIKQ